MRCEECGSVELEDDRRSGDLVCIGCGLICRQRTMVPDFDVRVFAESGDAEMRRTGAPEMPGISDGRLETVVAAPAAWAGPSGVAGSAGRLSASQRAHDGQGPRARAAKHEQAVEAVCSRLELPTCISDAAKRICAQLDAPLAGSGAGAAAAAVLLACEAWGVPRTLKEMAAAAGDQASVQQIVTAKKAAQKLLHIHPVLSTPAGLVPRFCSNLQVEQPVERLATVYAEQGASKADLCGRVPASVAAAAILLASRELAGRGGAGAAVSAEDVAAVSGAAASTVAAVARKLAAALGVSGA